MNSVINILNNFGDEIPSGFSIYCDMDGTLIDTDYANYLAYSRAILEVTRGMHNVQFDYTERLHRESLKKRIPGLTDDQLENISVLKTGYFCDYLQETKLNCDLATLIKKCSQTIPVVLVTSCRQSRAVNTLQYHNILECFTRLICREELLRSGASNKYAYALTLMCANPYAVLVFENEITDIENAMLAGVPRKNIISSGFQG